MPPILAFADSYLPSTFLEVLIASCVAAAILLCLLSLVPALRPTAIRVAALLVLTALSLASDHWTTYFAAIFIIATAVTELEFLHILAAIIRGDKNYFDFRREFLTREEAIKKTVADTVEPDEPTEGESSTTALQSVLLPPDPARLSHTFRQQLALRIEEAALSWTEKEIGGSLQRYVRFAGSAGIVEVDGYMQGSGRAPDTLVETKWARNPKLMVSLVLHTTPRLVELYHRYKNITGRDAELIVVLVLSKLDESAERMQEKLRARLKESGVRFRVYFLEYDKLGLTIDPDAHGTELGTT